MITLQDIKKNKEISALVEAANRNLEVMGFTEHGERHVRYVAKTSANILRALGYSDRLIELGEITGYLHDIGNAVNRYDHAISGAVLAYDILARMGMDPKEIMQIVGAIGNHDEHTGRPINIVSAALTIADKSDAHRSRVGVKAHGDIHGRVNLSILKNFITVDSEKKIIKLFIFMDTKISAVMEFLEIYLKRMTMCEQAANMLGCSFELYINRILINRKAAVTTDVKLEKSEKSVSQE